jgi:hypothetical protein
MQVFYFSQFQIRKLFGLMPLSQLSKLLKCESSQIANPTFFYDKSGNRKSAYFSAVLVHYLKYANICGFTQVLSPQKSGSVNCKPAIRPKILGLQIANPHLPHFRKVYKSKTFVISQMFGFAICLTYSPLQKFHKNIKMVLANL